MGTPRVVGFQLFFSIVSLSLVNISLFRNKFCNIISFYVARHPNSKNSKNSKNLHSMIVFVWKIFLCQQAAEMPVQVLVLAERWLRYNILLQYCSDLYIADERFVF